MFTKEQLDEMFIASAKLGAHITLIREGIQEKINEKELVKQFIAIGDIINNKVEEKCQEIPETKNCKTTYPINPASDFNDWMQHVFNPERQIH